MAVPVGTDQVNVVPDGIIPFKISVGVMAKPVPLQVVAVKAFKNALGFKVIVRLNAAPVQTPDNGVTI